MTGGAGFIGSHTCVELLGSGYEVVIVDNLLNSKASVVDRVATITGKQPTLERVDVRDVAALRSIFAEHKFDAVIHFAGLKAVGESVRQHVGVMSGDGGIRRVLLVPTRCVGIRVVPRCGTVFNAARWFCIPTRRVGTRHHANHVESRRSIAYFRQAPDC